MRILHSIQDKRWVVQGVLEETPYNCSALSNSVRLYQRVYKESFSSPSSFSYQDCKKDCYLCQDSNPFLVEARGVEPLSENNLTRTSPSAVCYLHSLTGAGTNTLRGLVASLCMVRSKLCARTSTTKSRPSPGRGPPGVDGLPNQAARATVLVSVNFRNLPGLKRSGTSARCSGLTIPVETGTPPYLRPETGAVVDYLNLA